MSWKVLSEQVLNTALENKARSGDGHETTCFWIGSQLRALRLTGNLTLAKSTSIIFAYCYARSQNCEKRILDRSCLSDCTSSRLSLSLCPHGRPLFPHRQLHEGLYTFMVIYRTKCGRSQNKFRSQVFLRKLCCLGNNVEKFVRSRQAVFGNVMRWRKDENSVRGD